MSYQGSTYQIPCNRGGLQRNNNIDLIPPEGMVHPSKNINIHQGGRGKRGGTSVINNTPTAIDSSSRIRGIGYYRKEDGTEHVLVSTSTPKIFEDTSSGSGDWSSEITGASWTTANKTAMFEQMDDLIFICNGADTPQQYNGAGNTSDVTTPPVDWSGTNNPTLMLKHGRGEAEKMWAIGVANQTQRVYYSKTRDPNDWTSIGAGNIDIETGDGFGIIGLAEFGERLICFGKKHVFLINDESVLTAEWGYQKAQWEGGAGNPRLIVTTPFDIFVMAEDGDIYSVSTAQEFGDYKSASVLRGSLMYEWVKEFVDLTNINDFHAVYDPVLRAIKWFIRRKSVSHIDTALIYFIDRDSSEAWMVHDNQSFDSGYKSSCSELVRTATGTFKIFTGGWDDGFVWSLETANQNDNSNAFAAGFRTARLPFENPRIRKRYDKGWIIAREEGNYNLDINWWVDGVSRTQRSVDLTPSGSFTLGTDKIGGDGVIETTLAFDNGTVAFVATEVVTGAGSATGTIDTVILTSGSWAGGDARGSFTLSAPSTGSFVQAETITGSGSGEAKVWNDANFYGSHQATTALGGDAFIDADFELGEYGKRIEFEIFNNRVNEDFFISQILIDHQPLGADIGE